MTALSVADVDQDAVRAALDGNDETTAGEPTSLALLPVPSEELVATLRNHGAPIVLGEVDGTEVPVYLRVTLNYVADVEERWGTVDAWQDALARQPAIATRESLALLLMPGFSDLPADEQKVLLRGFGDRLVRPIGEYQDALVTAWQVGNGLDPQKAAALLTAADAIRNAVRDGIEALTMDASRSGSGSEPG